MIEDQKKIERELAEIEKKIAEKVPYIEVDKTRKGFSIDISKLRKLAEKIQKFEDNSGAASISKSRI